MNYVLGFAFDDLGRVALITKKRPHWQNGLLNGIGGKIQSGESPFKAMVREFYEETGVGIAHDGWRLCGELTGQLREKTPADTFEDWTVYVFTTTSQMVRNVHTTTDERVNLIMAYQVSSMLCIENVPALIELCRLPIAQPSNSRPYFVLRY